uniref:Transmembrane protein n=1 Tax=Steinernema glaseri TaxID=37863 RepID=A0A1I8AIV8_9BILA
MRRPQARTSKERTPKLFFNCGRPANLCFLATFVFALLFFSAHFNELQMDSEVFILDLHTVYPAMILYMLPLVSSHAKWLSASAFAAHSYGMYSSKARVILPDLLAIGTWIFTIGCHLMPGSSPDFYLVRFIGAGILCVTTASVAFLPRKSKHRKRPNTIMSAFSVASTPVSQCTTLCSQSMLSADNESLFSTPVKPRSPGSVIASGRQKETQYRERRVTPTRDLSEILGGLKLDTENNSENTTRRRRGPFSSITYNPSVFDGRREGSLGRADSLGYGYNASIYAPSQALSQAPSKMRSLRAPPSVFTSVSQQNSQWSSSTSVLVAAAVAVSVATNCAMFAYMYYDRRQ